MHHDLPALPAAHNLQAFLSLRVDPLVQDYPALQSVPGYLENLDDPEDLDFPGIKKRTNLDLALQLIARIQVEKSFL